MTPVGKRCASFSTVKTADKRPLITAAWPPTWTSSLSDFYRVLALGRNILHRGSAVKFVPGKRKTLNGPLQGPEQNQRKDLAIGEPLQPNLAEQPGVLAGFRLAALESEGQRRSQEINHQKRSKEDQQAMETGGIVRFRM